MQYLLHDNLLLLLRLQIHVTPRLISMGRFGMPQMEVAPLHVTKRARLLESLPVILLQ